jgi:hypothetical protein
MWRFLRAALLNTLVPYYNSCRIPGTSNWDVELLARKLNLAQLAREVTSWDPSKRASEDKLDQLANLVSALEKLAPAMAAAGVHAAVLELHRR